MDRGPATCRPATEAEIHYTLDEPYWGRGLTTEACAAILDRAFAGFPQHQRVLSAADTANRASTRVMEKIGMSPVGSYEEYWPKDGKVHHHSLFAITRGRWGEDRSRVSKSG